MYEETRSALLGQTQVVFYLVDLLQDKNKEVGDAGTVHGQDPSTTATQWHPGFTRQTPLQQLLPLYR